MQRTSPMAANLPRLTTRLGGRAEAGHTDQLHGLAGFALQAQGAGLNIGFIPLGIGSAVFALLLLREFFYAMVPMFIDEVSLGLWLLIRGVNIDRAATQGKPWVAAQVGR